LKLAAFPKCYMDAICVERSMSVFDWIELARQRLKPLGVSGLEMYSGFFADMEEDDLLKVRHALERAEFEMPMYCASPDFTHPSREARLAAVKEQNRQIDLAAFFGAATCRVLSGQRRPEVGEEEGIEWVVECLRELLPHAEACGVILAMENHFKDNYWDYPEFAQSMSRFCRIVDQVEGPWFGVNFDPSNTLLAGEDPLELLRRVAPRVVTMHASDRRPKPGVEIGPEGVTDYSQLVHGEVGTGLIDYDAIFGILRGAGFDGWVSIEDGVNGIEELERSASFLAGKMGL
jgi:sugar phosphate isomerase/epimerase